MLCQALACVGALGRAGVSVWSPQAAAAATSPKAQTAIHAPPCQAAAARAEPAAPPRNMPPMNTVLTRLRASGCSP